MPLVAPLRVTVEIALTAGPAAGQRRFRLARSLSWPDPALSFAAPLPLEGEGSGRVSFELPTGEPIAADARLFFDPERPVAGSAAELLGLSAADQRAIEAYVEQRMKP